MKKVPGFHSAREAKEFLISKIVEEAIREGTVLSEIERKMLYFSETDWTLPDISAVSDEFDRGYDQGEFESKIAGLVRHVPAGSNQNVDASFEANCLARAQNKPLQRRCAQPGNLLLERHH